MTSSIQFSAPWRASLSIFRPASLADVSAITIQRAIVHVSLLIAGSSESGLDVQVAKPNATTLAVVKTSP